VLTKGRSLVRAEILRDRAQNEIPEQEGDRRTKIARADLQQQDQPARALRRLRPVHRPFPGRLETAGHGGSAQGTGRAFSQLRREPFIRRQGRRGPRVHTDGPRDVRRLRAIPGIRDGNRRQDAERAHEKKRLRGIVRSPFRVRVRHRERRLRQDAPRRHRQLPPARDRLDNPAGCPRAHRRIARIAREGRL